MTENGRKKQGLYYLMRWRYRRKKKVEKDSSCKCYLSFTSLSVNGFLGWRFIISDSAASYAREMAGTFTICFSTGHEADVQKKVEKKERDKT